LILKAFQKIQTQLKDHHLVIVGLGLDKYVYSLKHLAKKLKIENKVHFTGFKENVWQYYPSFDCTILASRDIGGIPFEGVPQSIMEAMFCSCPVVGSKSGGIPDIIEHEKTGLLFDVDDPKDLSDKVIQTVMDKKATEQRVAKAHEMVNKKHTIDVMSRNVLRIFQLHQIKLKNNTL